MRWWIVVGLVAGALAAACGGKDWRANVPPKYLGVAEVHHAHCGGCHVRVDPGQRTREHFVKALSRHHARVKMSDHDWALLVDYLSEKP